jgi:NAD(P)H-hydrate epimerase
MVAIEMNAVYLGFSRLLMMENAGYSVAEEVKKQFNRDHEIIIICGGGGNGGDGFVIARHLANEGYSIKVILIGSSDDIISSEAKKNWEIIEGMENSLKYIEWKDSSDITPLKTDIIIDSLIGIGISGALRSPYSDVVKEINAADSYVISVDIPTGVQADAGEVRGEAINANKTITFHKPKIGFKKNPQQLGELIIRKIGIPKEAELYTGPGDIKLVHPTRLSNSHKGMFGRLLVIGGSEMYSGAPALTGMAGYSTGVDLVYLAVPETAANIVAGFSPSMIVIKLEGRNLSFRNRKKIESILDKIDAIALGPGLGLHEDTIKEVLYLIEAIQKMEIPLLLDADALKIFPEGKIEIKTPTIFTPHRKEFEILTGKSIQGTITERSKIVEEEARKLNATILLKSPIDIISDGVRTRYNRTGNPGMTVGGTGDVLSGVTAGFMAMGSSPYFAGNAAAFINGLAGDKVYKRKGYHILPEDLVKEIPFIIEDGIKEKIKRN